MRAIINNTIVEVLNFQKFLSCTLGSMGDCKTFNTLVIAKFWQRVSRIDKLNGCMRKTEYFSFLKHPFHRIFPSTIKMTNYPKSAVVAATDQSNNPHQQVTAQDYTTLSAAISDSLEQLLQNS